MSASYRDQLWSQAESIHHGLTGQQETPVLPFIDPNNIKQLKTFVTSAARYGVLPTARVLATRTLSHEEIVLDRLDRQSAIFAQRCIDHSGLTGLDAYDLYDAFRALYKQMFFDGVSTDQVTNEVMEVA